MEISKGKTPGATKLVLYAPEGFGKSTFASKFQDPLYIDTEGSTKELDVRRFSAEMTWANILEAAQYVVDNPDCCKTLVLDTADWAENACITALNVEYKTKNILTMDYGKGSLYVVAEFQKLLEKLDKIINSGISVVMLAHAAIRKQELPEEMGAFDHWELKLQSKQVKALVKEWADLLIFGNYKTLVYENEKTKNKKALGGERVMYTEHHPCWDAKNRHGLKPELPFEYKEIRHIFEKGVAPKAEKPKESTKKPEPEPAKKTQAPKQEKPAEKPAEKPSSTLSETDIENIKAAKIPDALKDLMLENGVAIGEIESAVADKGLYPFDTALQDYEPDFIQNMLIDKWAGLYKRIVKYRDNNPFFPKKEDK